MKFDHDRQHSMAGLARLQALVDNGQWPIRQALIIADELVSHAHPAAPRAINILRQARHADVIAHAERLEKCQHELRARFRLEDCDNGLVNLTYRQNGSVYFPGAPGSRKLLVLFTTMFNNFYVSNLAMFSLLQELGCHLLILKDATLANYHRGVEGFAPDMPGIAARIRAIAVEIGATDIYLSGFSSGGYAAMLCSLILPAKGYLGFSHKTDLSAGTLLPGSNYFTTEVRAALDPRGLQDLRPALLAADTAVPRRLYYGDQSDADMQHARHLDDVAGIELVCLPATGHNSVQHLLAEQQLVEVFRQLLADR